jgi:tRNA pseudouridine13 synthase
VASATDQHGEARALYGAGRFDAAIDAFPRSLRTERALLGALARGATPAQALTRMDEAARRFMVSAFQSAVFNAVLDARMADGSYGRLGAGDVAHVHESRGLFVVDEAVLAEPGLAERVRRLELSPTGPMWGASMKRATGAVDAAEIAALEAHGVRLADIEAYAAKRRDDLEGSRRPLRVPVIAPQVEGGLDEHGSYVRVAFELPRGAFATVVLREIMKPAGGAGIETEA